MTKNNNNIVRGIFGVVFVGITILLSIWFFSTILITESGININSNNITCYSSLITILVSSFILIGVPFGYLLVLDFMNNTIGDIVSIIIFFSYIVYMSVVVLAFSPYWWMSLILILGTGWFYRELSIHFS